MVSLQYPLFILLGKFQAAKKLWVNIKAVYSPKYLYGPLFLEWVLQLLQCLQRLGKARDPYKSVRRLLLLQFLASPAIPSPDLIFAAPEEMMMQFQKDLNG